jgi:hypothetical protein
MVDNPSDVSKIPGHQHQKPPEPEAAGGAKKSSFPSVFPMMQFGEGSGISEAEFRKKFWEMMEKSIGDVVNHGLARMKEANEKLRKSMEGTEE